MSTEERGQAVSLLFAGAREALLARDSTGAVRCLLAAVDEASQSGAPSAVLEARARFALGSVLVQPWYGRFMHARSELERAALLLASEGTLVNVALRCEVLAVLTSAYEALNMGHLLRHTMRELFETAGKVASNRDGVLCAAACACFVELRLGDHVRAQQWAETAHTVARRGGDVLQQIYATALEAYYRLHRKEFDAARRAIERGVDALNGEGDLAQRQPAPSVEEASAVAVLLRVLEVSLLAQRGAVGTASLPLAEMNRAVGIASNAGESVRFLWASVPAMRALSALFAARVSRASGDISSTHTHIQRALDDAQLSLDVLSVSPEWHAVDRFVWGATKEEAAAVSVLAFQFPKACRHLHDVATHVPFHVSAERQRIHVVIASYLYACGCLDEAIEHAQLVASGAEDDSRMAMHAAVVACLAHCAKGTSESRSAALRILSSIAKYEDAMADSDLALLAARGTALVQVQKFTEAKEPLGSLLRASQGQLQSCPFTALALALLGRVFHSLQQLQQARDMLSNALVLAARGEDLFTQSSVQTALQSVYRGLDDGSREHASASACAQNAQQWASARTAALAMDEHLYLAKWDLA